MARLHPNACSGVLDAQLLAGGTTMSSPGLADLPAVSGGNTIDVTLDFDAVGGKPEVVRVTAHTASATTATISRAAQTDGGLSAVARQHEIGVRWAAALTKTDVTGTTPHASAPGDSAAAGATGVFADADHVHARESFGVVGSMFGIQNTGNSAGTAAGLARIDHTHNLSIDDIAFFSATLRPVTICTSGTRPTSPSVGDSIFETNTGNFLQYQSVATGWTPPWDTAWGRLAAPVTSASSQAFTSTEVAIAVANAVTVPANRQIEIVFSCQAFSSTGTSDTALVKVYRDSTQIGEFSFFCVSGTSGACTGIICPVVDAPAAGAHTYSVKAIRTSGTGTWNSIGNANQPRTISVIDVGSTAAPA